MSVNNGNSNATSFEAFTTSVIAGYSKGPILGRFSDAVEISDGYSGALPTAWGSAEVIGGSVQADYSFGAEEVISPYELGQLRQTAIRIKNAGLSSVVIEAAHAYMHETLDDPTFVENVVAQCRQAGLLSGLLREEGIATTHLLFVDDYNPDPVDGERKDVLEIDDLIDVATQSGFDPQYLMREASMVGLAKEIIKVMDEEQKLVVRADVDPEEDGEPSLGKDSDLYLSRRGIELFRGSDGMVSCAMLDASLSIVKLTQVAEGLVNVLPRSPEGQDFSYRGQQKKMRTILGEHLGVRVTPVFNLFVSPGESARSLAFGSHHTLRKPRS